MKGTQQARICSLKREIQLRVVCVAVKKIPFLWMTSPRGSTYKGNKIGPKMNPCGTPYLIQEIDDV